MYMPYWIIRRYEADKGGAGGGGEQKPEPPPATTTGNPPTDPTAGGEAGNKPADGGEIKMTSAQLSERLNRARSAERLELAKSFGYNSVEDFQAAVKAGEEARKAQLTDAERQAAELKKAQDEAATMKTRLDQAEAERKQSAIRLAAVDLMAERFTKPGTAFKLLDMSGVVVDETGNITGLKEAVDKLAQDEPWTLKAGGDRKKRDMTPLTTNPKDEGEDKESDAERRARYFGGGSKDFFRGAGVKPTVTKRPGG
jgi:hypothetical protein